MKKPKLVKKGVPMEAVDSRLSKLSMPELLAKRDEVSGQLRVIEEFIETKKSERANELISELKALGITASISTASPVGRAPRQAGEKKQRQSDPNKKCPQCGALGHDRRFHRKENIAKKAAPAA